MITTLAATLLLGLAGQTPQTPGAGPPDQVPQKKELFANEEWYQGQQGKEQAFVGVLERIQRGGIGFGRFNPYRLVMGMPGGAAVVREVYVGGKPDLLAPYVGKRVRLIGKAVDMEVEGRLHREIWPARLEVIGGKGNGPGQGTGQGGPADGKALKVFAKGPWHHVSTDPDGPKEGKQVVIRNPEELANYPPWNNLDAVPAVVGRRAAEEIARELKVNAIDWKKQMLIVVTAGVRPTGGYKIDITSLVVRKDGKLWVTWQLTPPQGIATQAFTHPAVVALTERFDGPVQFVAAGGPRIKPGLPPRQGDEVLAPDGSAVVHVAAQAGGDSQPGTKGQAPRIIAKTPRLAVNVKGHAVLRNAQDLVKHLKPGTTEREATEQLAKTLGVPDIDWAKQMVVLIDGGVRRTGGYSVQVGDLSVKDNTLTVHWQIKGPPPGSFVTQALTHPGATLLLERFNGDVRVEPPAPKGGKLLR